MLGWVTRSTMWPLGSLLKLQWLPRLARPALDGLGTDFSLWG